MVLIQFPGSCEVLVSVTEYDATPHDESAVSYGILESRMYEMLFARRHPLQVRVVAVEGNLSFDGRRWFRHAHTQN